VPEGLRSLFYQVDRVAGTAAGGDCARFHDAILNRWAAETHGNFRQGYVLRMGACFRQTDHDQIFVRNGGAGGCSV